MTQRNHKLLILFALASLSCMLAYAVPPYSSDSTFQPSIYSKVRHSLLNENPSLYRHEFSSADDGLQHPFRSLSTVGSALREAFDSGEPQSNLLSYRYGPFAADFKIIAGYEASFKDPGDYGFLYKGWRVNANYMDALHLNTYWYNGAFFGDLDAAENDPLIDGYYKHHNNRIQLDNLSGEFGYYKDHYNLALGRGRFQIGNNISGSIILNDQVNDYAYLKAEATLGSFRFSFLHGSLMADSTFSIYDNAQIDAKNYPDKFIALHQISFFPWENTELFAGETVVYGNRGMDLNYLMPNSFWRSVEHDLWDRDNVLIYGGINQLLPRGILLYAQMALDEFSYGKILSSWWGNKYALQGGISLPVQNARFGLEASAVRPYTYAHFMNHTMYSHDRRPLGYPQGSNVLDLSFEANIPFKPYFCFDTQLSWRRRGSLGNSWQDNYHDLFAGQINDASAYWFDGETSEEYQIRSSLMIPILAHHQFLLGHDSLKQASWQHRLIAAWQFIF